MIALEVLTVSAVTPQMKKNIAGCEILITGNTDLGIFSALNSDSAGLVNASYFHREVWRLITC